jgi:hypothetical protein
MKVIITEDFYILDAKRGKNARCLNPIHRFALPARDGVMKRTGLPP